MAAKRRSRATGVGKGNGPGSRVSHYRHGEPTANPRGRPRGPRPAPNVDLRAALRRHLAAKVKLTENGVTRLVPQGEAMIAIMAARFPTTTPNEQANCMRLMLLMLEDAPSAPESYPRSPSPQSVQEFVRGLAEEAKLELDDNGGGYHYPKEG